MSKRSVRTKYESVIIKLHAKCSCLEWTEVPKGAKMTQTHRSTVLCQERNEDHECLQYL